VRLNRQLRPFPPKTMVPRLKANSRRVRYQKYRRHNR
jgi:hypothetical protein